MQASQNNRAVIAGTIPREWYEKLTAFPKVYSYQEPPKGVVAELGVVVGIPIPETNITVWPFIPITGKGNIIFFFSYDKSGDLHRIYISPVPISPDGDIDKLGKDAVKDREYFQSQKNTDMVSTTMAHLLYLGVEVGSMLQSGFLPRAAAVIAGASAGETLVNKLLHDDLQGALKNMPLVGTYHYDPDLNPAQYHVYPPDIQNVFLMVWGRDAERAEKDWVEENNLSSQELLVRLFNSPNYERHSRKVKGGRTLFIEEMLNNGQKTSIPISSKRDWGFLTYRNLFDEKGRYYQGPVIRGASMGQRPNLVYEYKGYKPDIWGWRMTKDKLIELLNIDVKR